jgi:hypothetical protein
VDPRDADAVSDVERVAPTCDDVADHLMSWYHGKPRRLEPAVYDVEVRATHGANAHAD